MKKNFIEAYVNAFSELSDYIITDQFSSLSRKLLTKSGYISFSSWVFINPYLNVFKIYDFEYKFCCTNHGLFTIDENRKVKNEISFVSTEENFFQNSLVNDHYDITFEDLQLFKCYSIFLLNMSTEIYTEMNKKYYEYLGKQQNDINNFFARSTSTN